jgi:hypothetical protein
MVNRKEDYCHRESEPTNGKNESEPVPNLSHLVHDVGEFVLHVFILFAVDLK